MTTPIFQDLCINFDELLQVPDLATMLKVLNKQSSHSEAIKRTDPLNAKFYEPEEECPLYFGLGFEWLSYHFLNRYGHYWNITNTSMTMVSGQFNKDVGVDGRAMT